MKSNHISYSVMNEDGTVESMSMDIGHFFKDDWQPYPTKKEIRPERVGELWQFENTIFMIQEQVGKQFVAICSYRIRYKDMPPDEMREMIHNQNGWQLIYSPDKEAMKELEGDKVVMGEVTLFDGIQNYLVCDCKKMDFIIKNLLFKEAENEPHVTMTLAWTKEA